MDDEPRLSQSNLDVPIQNSGDGDAKPVSVRREVYAPALPQNQVFFAFCAGSISHTKRVAAEICVRVLDLFLRTPKVTKK